MLNMRAENSIVRLKREETQLISETRRWLERVEMFNI